MFLHQGGGAFWPSWCVWGRACGVSGRPPRADLGDCAVAEEVEDELLQGALVLRRGIEMHGDVLGIEPLIARRGAAGPSRLAAVIRAGNRGDPSPKTRSKGASLEPFERLQQTDATCPRQQRLMACRIWRFAQRLLLRRGSVTPVRQSFPHAPQVDLAITDDTRSAAAFTGSVARCAYRAVVATCVWPRSLPIIGNPWPAATARTRTCGAGRGCGRR